jgi:hypothetical protein
MAQNWDERNERTILETVRVMRELTTALIGCSRSQSAKKGVLAVDRGGQKPVFEVNPASRRICELRLQPR